MTDEKIFEKDEKFYNSELNELLARRQRAVIAGDHDEILIVAEVLRQMERIYKQKIIDVKLELLETKKYLGKVLN
jgi:acid stress-induced BolA-like protein IbaG/YrbA